MRRVIESTLHNNTFFRDTEMEENDEIRVELKSEPMNEMLSHPPGWIIRSGNGLFLIILLLMLGLSWFIQYSDEAAGEVEVTSFYPPIELSNQSYVQLKALYAHDGQWVRKGTILAQFDHHADAEDIRKASDYLRELETKDLSVSGLLPVPAKNLKLGVFEEKWALLERYIADWNTQKSDNLIQKQMATVQREIHYRQELQRISGTKIKLSESEYDMIRKEVESSERLANQHAVSKQTLNQEKRTENQALQTIQGQKEQHIQNLIMLNTLQKELVQLEHEQLTKTQQQTAEIRGAIAALRNGLSEWEQNAVWKAPCDGKVLFNKQLQVHKYYTANQASMVVVPNGNGYSAIATVSGMGTGKIKPGQTVFIELADYPKSEFGQIQGSVKHITQIDKEGKYEVAIRLPKRLSTTHHRKIPAKAKFRGTAKIITKKKRLLERFFEKLTDLIQ